LIGRFHASNRDYEKELSLEGSPLPDASGCNGFPSRDEQRTQRAQALGLIAWVEWLVAFSSLLNATEIFP
jgi:hypothetical protein